MLRRLARAVGIPPGAIMSDLPERFGIPSVIQPDLHKHWRRVLARSRRALALLPPITGPRVAILITLGKGVSNPGYAAVLAYALRLRGADPVIVYCDAWLEGCEHPTIAYMTPERFVREGPRPLCEACSAPGAALYRILGVEVHALSEFLDTAALETVRRTMAAIDSDRYYDFEDRGMPLGQQVDATIARFFYTHVAERSERSIPVARRMVHGALMMAEATIRMAERLRIDVVAPHYGAYASRGTAALAARAAGRRCIVWSPGYVDETLLLGDQENAFTELAARTRGPWSDGPLSVEQDRELTALLAEIAGESAVIPDPSDERGRLRERLRLDPDRQIVALYTNVGFDTKLFYDTPAYPDVLRWIYDSIEIFGGRPEHLVIRIHPGEVWLDVIDKDQTLKAIAQRFPRLPENVRIVAADDPISSYALGRAAKACLVYGSLIGLELAARGRPVVVAGRGVYWRKGFTTDVGSRAEYEAVAKRLEEIARPDEERRRRARRFAHYFYVERQIPFRQWNHDHRPGTRLPKWWHAFRSLEDLRPGRDADLDAICLQLMGGPEATTQGESLRRAPRIVSAPEE